MSRNLNRLLFSTCFIVLITGVNLANHEVSRRSERVKTVSRKFKVPHTVNVKLINKYGPVIVNTWNVDSVKIDIEVTAYGKTSSEAYKILDRVDFDFFYNRDFLKIETVLDRKASFFKELWRDIGDYSKTLLSKTKMRIEFEIYIPAYSNLTIENKFGDIYLDEMFGELSVDLSYGNLRANNLSNNSAVSVSFGEARIKTFDRGRVELKASTMDIEKTGNLEITSSSSTLTINQANVLKVDSRSDKRLQFDTVNRLIGSSNFSKIYVGNLAQEIVMETVFGELIIEDIGIHFNQVDVNGKATDVRLHFSPESYFTVDIEAREDKLQLPSGAVNLDTNYIDERKKFVEVSGTVGKPSNNPSKVKVNVQNGDLYIIIRQGLK